MDMGRFEMKHVIPPQKNYAFPAYSGTVRNEANVNKNCF